MSTFSLFNLKIVKKIKRNQAFLTSIIKKTLIKVSITFSYAKMIFQD